MIAARAAARRLIEATRPADRAVLEAVARRWDELPERIRTPSQLMGRRFTGCEGTHGVFPRCNFGCSPCYHSADANRVRVDGEHTAAEVAAQMRYLLDRRGPGQFAQLIGGEASLLEPEDHARALEVMWAHGRVPMSFTHGDFDDDYLRAVALGADGSPRFPFLAFAVHIDSTMTGRRSVHRPTREADLHDERARVAEMFTRLRRDTGIRTYLAHNMTVTPGNLAEVPDVGRTCRRLDYQLIAHQPAAYVGNERRWERGYRSFGADEVWAAISEGAETRLPYTAIQIGDERCNRSTWGIEAGGRYTPVLDDADPADLAVRDAFFAAFPGSFQFVARPIVWARVARAAAANPRIAPLAAGWARRFVRRAGGLRALRRGGRPLTFAMHRFMDASLVGAAWSMLEDGVDHSPDRDVQETIERLAACAYVMAHPQRDQLVPACVQHAVLDPVENRELAVRLPLRRRDGTDVLA